MLVRLDAHSGIPGIMQIPILILSFLPQFRVLCLDGSYEFLRFALNLEFRMHSGQEENVYLYFAELRCLLVHRPMRAEEDHQIEGDQGDRDNWPATPLHVFVTQRDQHTVICLVSRSGTKLRRFLKSIEARGRLEGYLPRLLAISYSLRFGHLGKVNQSD